MKINETVNYFIFQTQAVVTVDHSYIPHHGSNWIQTNIQVISIYTVEMQYSCKLYTLYQYSDS